MIRALAAVLTAAVLALGVQTWRLDSAQDELHEQERLAAAELLAAEQRYREKEQEYAANARKAGQIYATQSARVRADADGALSELERLRDALSRSVPSAPDDPASAPGADVAARLVLVVNECSAALSTVAATADRTAAQLAALQAYVTGIIKE